MKFDPLVIVFESDGDLYLSILAIEFSPLFSFLVKVKFLLLRIITCMYEYSMQIFAVSMSPATTMAKFYVVLATSQLELVLHVVGSVHSPCFFCIWNRTPNTEVQICLLHCGIATSLKTHVPEVTMVTACDWKAFSQPLTVAHCVRECSQLFTVMLASHCPEVDSRWIPKYTIKYNK